MELKGLPSFALDSLFINPRIAIWLVSPSLSYFADNRATNLYVGGDLSLSFPLVFSRAFNEFRIITRNYRSCAAFERRSGFSGLFGPRATSSDNRDPSTCR